MYNDVSIYVYIDPGVMIMMGMMGCELSLDDWDTIWYNYGGYKII